MGPLEDDAIWQTDNMTGVRRFLERTHRLYFPEQEHEAAEVVPEELDKLMHKTIQKVTEDLDQMHPNTAVSQMMIYTNEATKLGYIPNEHKPILARLLSPFAPHLAEEFWEDNWQKGSVTQADWPEFDAEKIIDKQAEIPVQVNGKVRAVVTVRAGASEAEVRAEAMEKDGVAKYTQGMDVVKVIFRTDKMLNLVVKPLST